MTDETEIKELEAAESNEASSFENQAAQQQQGIVAEFIDFLKYNKKWWLTPIVLVLLLVGLLVFLSGTAAAPFIYPMF